MVQITNNPVYTARLQSESGWTKKQEKNSAMHAAEVDPKPESGKASADDLNKFKKELASHLVHGTPINPETEEEKELVRRVFEVENEIYEEQRILDETYGINRSRYHTPSPNGAHYTTPPDLVRQLNSDGSISLGTGKPGVTFPSMATGQSVYEDHQIITAINDGRASYWNTLSAKQADQAKDIFHVSVANGESLEDALDLTFELLTPGNKELERTHGQWEYLLNGEVDLKSVLDGSYDWRSAEDAESVAADIQSLKEGNHLLSRKTPASPRDITTLFYNGNESESGTAFHEIVLNNGLRIDVTEEGKLSYEPPFMGA
ncbi:MAG: hypothetical protein V3U76_09465, partial [Granulosicoccus sp.]